VNDTASRGGLETDDARLPLSEHLVELRTRAIRSVLGFLVAFIVAWIFHKEIFAWFMEPYRDGMFAVTGEADEKLFFRGVTEPFLVYLKSSAMGATLLALPFAMLQVWLFVAPGLYRHERRLALPFVTSAYVFFLGGALFCRYLVLEPAITVLIGIGDDNTLAQIMMEDYLSFASRMMLVFGLLFELPVAISFLAWTGIITHVGLLKNWRYSVVVAFVVGAMLTPPDPLTQTALAVPLVVLYFLSTGVAWMITRSRQRRALEESAT
jgi:sec-independent protein translocase protein TatC